MATEETPPTPELGPEVDGVEQAKQIVEESEFGSRKVTGLSKHTISIVAAAWSLFQLSLPKFIMLSAVYIRAKKIRVSLYIQASGQLPAAADFRQMK